MNYPKSCKTEGQEQNQEAQRTFRRAGGSFLRDEDYRQHVESWRDALDVEQDALDKYGYARVRAADLFCSAKTDKLKRAKEAGETLGLGTGSIVGRSDRSECGECDGVCGFDGSWVPLKGWKAQVKVLPGGIKVESSPGGAVYRSRSGGTRGKIRGFSKKSARRLREKIASIPLKKYVADGKRARKSRGFFFTLTYPSRWPDAKTVKEDLHSLHKRLCRQFPGYLGFAWKLEAQQRGAPHFHLIVLFEEKVSKRGVRSWAKTAWFEVVGSEDRNHRHQGAQVDVLYDSDRAGKALLFYLSDYMCKEADDENAWGRRWGVYGDVPMGSEVIVRFSSREQFWEFLRRLRRWGKGSNYLQDARGFWSGLVLGWNVRELLRGLGEFDVVSGCPI